MRATAANAAANPAVGINATYAKIRGYVDAAVTLRESLFRRWVRDWVDQQGFVARRYLRVMGMPVWGALLVRSVGGLGPTRPLGAQNREKFAALATEAERELPEFAHATAEYWIESFASDCCTRFQLDMTKVLALRQVNDLRESPTPFQRLTSPQRFLAVAGIALGLFASLVPKEAFEALGWTAHSYGVVRVALAFVILSITAYLALIAVSARTGASRIQRRVAKAMPDVLTYCEIACRFDRESSGQ